MTLVVLPSSRMVPLPELFWHPSTLHGQAHVTRVMVHAIRLVAATGQHEQGPRLWAAVFLHDIARRHDGVCHQHGADAAQRLRAEPPLQERLAEAGLTMADYSAIEAAVTAHSAPKEVAREHPHWPLIALLKDADGLDRVRLGDLDPRRLRHAEAREMVPFAQELFDVTDGVVATGPAHFEQVWGVARRLQDAP
ncbi:MAG: hypothetical protein ABI665_20240 [Vicinamibacterales bacterium]